MKTITIRLASPLQSFGNEATFSHRTTELYPTKSLIVGMLAASLGYRRDDSRINQLNNLQIARRIEQPGKVLTDFQTVEFKPDTRKLTYRNYLQDGVFIVAISAHDKTIDKLKYALLHPKFQLYIGRRSNPIAGVLKINEFDDDALKVLKKLDWQASEWYQKKYKSEEYFAEIIADASLSKNNSGSLVKDAVGSFNQHSRFHDYRAVVNVHVSLKNKFYQEHSTKHDIFNAI